MTRTSRKNVVGAAGNGYLSETACKKQKASASSCPSSKKNSAQKWSPSRRFRSRVGSFCGQCLMNEWRRPASGYIIISFFTQGSLHCAICYVCVREWIFPFGAMLIHCLMPALRHNMVLLGRSLWMNQPIWTSRKRRLWTRCVRWGVPLHTYWERRDCRPSCFRLALCFFVYVSSHEFVQVLHEFKLYPTREEEQKRESVLARLDVLVKEWVRDVSKTRVRNDIQFWVQSSWGRYSSFGKSLTIYVLRASMTSFISV